jgi:hypothetical protein
VGSHTEEVNDMARKNVNYVERARIEALVATCGLRCEEKAGWTKVCGAGERRVYVPKSARVGRLDVAGMGDLELPEGVVALGGASFGAVTHQVDFTLPEASILACVDALLLLLATSPAGEKRQRPRPGVAARAAREPRAARAPQAAPVGGLSSQAKAERMALIRRVAAEKGVPVSASIMTEVALADEGGEDASDDVSLLPDDMGAEA